MSDDIPHGMPSDEGVDDPPDLGEDEVATLQRMAIVWDGGRYRVLERNGYYDRVGVSQLVHLPARIRELGMDFLVPLVRHNLKGEARDVSERILLRDHLVQVASVVGVSGRPGDPKAPPLGCWLRAGPDGGLELCVPCYGLRDDLAPLFDADVDEWLHRLVGPANYAKLVEWIAWALELGQPTCGIALIGASSAGKKMVACGLAECLTTGVLAKGEELVQRFQYGLAQSPFIWADEGLVQSGGSGTLHAIDKLRQLVANGEISVEQKFQAPMRIMSPVRVIITANNTEIMRDLVGARNLSPDDRRALGRRLLHMPVLKDAADWLDGRGGLRFTSHPGRRWLRSDGGQLSDYVVARHFLWLHANRKPAASGTRFSVEGDPNADLMLEVSRQTGDAPHVLEALVKLCESQSPRDREGFILDYDPVTGRPRACTLPADVLSYMRRTNAPIGPRMTAKKIASVFRSFEGTDAPTRTSIWRHPELPGRGSAAWYILDPANILHAAVDEGWPVGRLADHVVGKRRCGHLSPSGRGCHLVVGHRTHMHRDTVKKWK